MALSGLQIAGIVVGAGVVLFGVYSIASRPADTPAPPPVNMAPQTSGNSAADVLGGVGTLLQRGLSGVGAYRESSARADAIRSDAAQAATERNAITDPAEKARRLEAQRGSAA